jgi:hypothetical protein
MWKTKDHNVSETPVAISRRDREDNIGMDLREIRKEGMDGIHVAQDKDQDTFL